MIGYKIRANGGGGGGLVPCNACALLVSLSPKKNLPYLKNLGILKPRRWGWGATRKKNKL